MGCKQMTKSTHRSAQPGANTLHIPHTRSFASPARTHVAYELMTKTPRRLSPCSGMYLGFPLTSDNVASNQAVHSDDAHEMTFQLFFGSNLILGYPMRVPRLCWMNSIRQSSGT